MNCDSCGQKIDEFSNCFQVRKGYLDKSDEFFAREDVEYLCENCYAKRERT